MALFEDVKLTWNGREYTLPSQRVMRTISQIENHITLVELTEANERGSLPIAKLTAAFGILLRNAGAKVTDEDIYGAMFSSNENMAIMVQQSIEQLLTLMIPPKVLAKKLEDREEAEGKEAAEETSDQPAPSTTEDTTS